MIFRDRKDAGLRLAGKLSRYREPQPLVLGLPCGGVCVAFEVARALRAQLDVLVVQELGTLDRFEFAIGAVVEGGGVYLDPEALREAELTEEDAAAIAEQEVTVVARRARSHRGDRPPAPVAGRTVILVDDGVANAARACVGGRALRAWGACRVVLAAPVMARRAVAALSQEFDDVVAVEPPTDFVAVEYWYERFPEVSEAEAIELLRRGRPHRHQAAGARRRLSWRSRAAVPGS